MRTESRPPALGGCGQKKGSLSAIDTTGAQCTRAFCAPLLCRAQVKSATSSRVCGFFRKSTRADELSLQHVNGTWVKLYGLRNYGGFIITGSKVHRLPLHKTTDRYMSIRTYSYHPLPSPAIPISAGGLLI